MRRREFLSRGVGLFSIRCVGPELLTAMARASTNPLYSANRPTLGIPQNQVIPVSATRSSGLP